MRKLRLRFWIWVTLKLVDYLEGTMDKYYSVMSDEEYQELKAMIIENKIRALEMGKFL